MAANSVLAFWAVALLLIVVPGADWAFTIGAGMAKRSIVPAVGGLVIGYLIVTAIIAAGVGVLIASSPRALNALSLLGGGYLIWHGAMTVAKPARPGDPASGSPGSHWKTFLKGVGVSGLNPKALMMFLALLPQFTDTSWSWPMTGQLSALGMIFTVTCAIFYLCLGSVAQQLFRKRPGAGPVISRLSGAAMIVIGAALLIS